MRSKDLNSFNNILILICFLFFFSTSIAQSNKAYIDKLDIQGIPFNKSVKVLFQDSIGFLWIGTNSGLYRYDGNNLIGYQYNVFDPYSIPNNTINSIVEDENKNLWIGSESYLIYFNRKENNFKGFYKNIISKALYKSSNGNIWTNLSYKGLVLTKPNDDINKISRHYVPNHDFPNFSKFDKEINSFVEDNFGRNWIGTSKGILYLNKDNKFIASNFEKPVTAMKLFGNNQIVVITNKDVYILSYNKTNNNLEILEQYLDIISRLGINGTLKTLALNSKNLDLWIGTSQGLIQSKRINNSYSFNILQNGSNNDQLQSSQINSTIFDSYNNLWVGTSKGISKLLDRNSIFEFNNVKTDNKFGNSISNRILFYNANTILLGMENGLYMYNPKNSTYSKIELPISRIDRISFNHEKNKILISSVNTLFETEEYQPFKKQLKLTKIKTFSNWISDIAVINNNEICVGLWGKGISIVNKKNTLSKIKKNVISKLQQAHTSALLMTKENELWLGTRGEGLFKVNFNNETINEYLPKKDGGLTSNAILCLFEDREKNIWIGTRGGGLNLYIKSSNSFKHFETTNSANLVRTISSIQEDRFGNLWMSTQDGLLRFDVTTKKFTPFGIENGIDESDFAFNSSAASKNKEKLFFGCVNGFYTVNTADFSQKNIIPTTVITDFNTLEPAKIDDSNSKSSSIKKININSNKPTILPYDQNNIVVNFSSLDLTSPNKNQYAYMLEGLNNYWIYTNASNRNANYNDLPPGTYTFKVKSSNSDGVWNETPTSFTFKINPPYWKSNLAILIYWLLAVIISLISYLLIQRWYNLKKSLVKETIRREKDNEHNRMKMIFFTDISHELRTPLTLILGTIEKVVKEGKLNLSSLTAQRIYSNSLRMNRLINQIMDIRKFDVGEFKVSVSKNNIIQDIVNIKNAFNDFARIYHIKYEFISELNSIEAWYDVEIIEKILFNLLSNAFKYTPEKGKISVTVSTATEEDAKLDSLHLRKGKYIKCSVHDNGVGISKIDIGFVFDRYYQTTKIPSNQIPGTGIGMELAQKLIQIHHGGIVVDSEENVFTEFSFYLPIEKDHYKKREIQKHNVFISKSILESYEYTIIEDKAIDLNENEMQKNKLAPKIVLVEDNNDVRKMLKEELINDFYILEAANGKEAYELIEKEKPQLIISDILMPIEDGLSMLKRIKKNSEISNIPIFMLTAKNSEESKIECLSLGADDYIEKPFSLEFVKWKVKNILVKQKELKERYSKIISTEPSEIEVDSINEKFIKKLIKIIENSMDDNLLSVEYLASEVGMSRANLYRKLQAIINDTPVNFIKTIRLKRAAQLLKKSDMYISEIAYMTGFNNQKYFGKCFYKEYGMSPTDYVKKYGETEKSIHSIDFN